MVEGGLKIKAHFFKICHQSVSTTFKSFRSLQFNKTAKGFGASVISWMLFKPFRKTHFHLHVAISQRNNFV